MIFTALQVFLQTLGIGLQALDTFEQIVSFFCMGTGVLDIGLSFEQIVSFFCMGTGVLDIGLSFEQIVSFFCMGTGVLDIGLSSTCCFCGLCGEAEPNFKPATFDDGMSGDIVVAFFAG